MINGIKIIDAHVHCAQQFDAEELLMLTAGAGRGGNADMMSINAVAHSRCISLTPTALALKYSRPESCYAFGCLDVSEYYLHPETLGVRFAEYGERLIEMGCDGIKMLEGKPQMRKMYPVADFDAACFEPFWAWAEERGMPILWHVNDPENFWDAANAPEFAVKQGWLYDESYVNNEKQYTQVLNVLARHPRLSICFAHFFFMSAQLERLGAILEEYKNVRVDLTPGIEMYENFSKNATGAREFFARFHDRIIYGTDIGGRCVLMGEEKEFDELENRRRPEIVQAFLAGKEETEIASDGHFLIGRSAFTLRPLGLEGERLREVMSGNFESFAGKAPRRVEREAALEECARLRRRLSEAEEKIRGFRADFSVVQRAESVFRR